MIKITLGIMLIFWLFGQRSKIQERIDNRKQW